MSVDDDSVCDDEEDDNNEEEEYLVNTGAVTACRTNKCGCRHGICQKFYTPRFSG